MAERVEEEMELREEREIEEECLELHMYAGLGDVRAVCDPDGIFSKGRRGTLDGLWGSRPRPRPPSTDLLLPPLNSILPGDLSSSDTLRKRVESFKEGIVTAVALVLVVELEPKLAIEDGGMSAKDEGREIGRDKGSGKGILRCSAGVGRGGRLRLIVTVLDSLLEGTALP